MITNSIVKFEIILLCLWPFLVDAMLVTACISSEQPPPKGKEDRKTQTFISILNWIPVKLDAYSA